MSRIALITLFCTLLARLRLLASWAGCSIAVSRNVFRAPGRAAAAGVGMAGDVDVRAAVVGEQRPAPNVVVQVRVRAVPYRRGKAIDLEPVPRRHLPPGQAGRRMTAVALVQLSWHMDRGPVLGQVLVEELHEANAVGVLEHGLAQAAGV